jgi:hypothetical protein
MLVPGCLALSEVLFLLYDELREPPRRRHADGGASEVEQGDRLRRGDDAGRDMAVGVLR